MPVKDGGGWRMSPIAPTDTQYADWLSVVQQRGWPSAMLAVAHPLGLIVSTPASHIAKVTISSTPRRSSRPSAPASSARNVASRVTHRCQRA